MGSNQPAPKRGSRSVKRAILKFFIKWLAQASDRTWVCLTYAAEYLTFGKPAKDVIRGVRDLIKAKHPSIGLVRRILSDTDKKCRDKMIDNLIISGFLLNQEKKMAAYDNNQAIPSSILVSPTMRCNLNCIGCYASNYSKTDDLPFEIFDRVIKEAKEMGVAFFTLLGGEPLIWERLFDIFKKHNDVYFQCYTNGTLIDEKMADKFLEVGNVLPVISLEGYEKETDERRGPGTYQKVMRAMDILKEKKVPFGFSVAVTNKNIKLISSDEFIDFLINKGAFLGWFFLYMPVGRGPDLSLMPSPEDRRLLLDRVSHIRETKPILIIDFWNDAPFVGGCIAAKEYIHITASGDVEPCIFTHFAVDNIKNKSLAEVMNSDFFKALRERQPYNDNWFLPCMWIDNPEVSRELITKYHAYPTHEGADQILKDDELKAGVDAYSAKIKAIYDPLWQEKGKEYKRD